MISFANIKKNFGRETVLKGVSFRVEDGERLSLTGPGGCGKTTLLKILLGLLPPDEGEAELLHKNLFTISTDEKTELLKRVGMAFQQGGLFDFMTVRENIMFAMENMTNFTPEEMDARIKILMAAVKLPQTEHMYPHELSGGMQKRVGIARALATNPRVALFDEPTAGLDPVTSSIILNMIMELASEHKDASLIVSTSNVEIAIRFAERVIILCEGQIVADGPWRKLLLEGSEWVQNFLGIRLIGLDRTYAEELDLPDAFVKKHWN